MIRPDSCRGVTFCMQAIKSLLPTGNIPRYAKNKT